MLEALQTFSEESLNQEVYICGSDCMVNCVESISVNKEEYIDEDGCTIPAGVLVVEL